MKDNNFMVYIEQDEDGIFIGSIPSIPNCYAQGETKQELLINLKSVLKLCMRNTDFSEISHTKFIGVKELSYA